mgnify:CR=1 FL=1
MNIILACDSEYGIGINNNLPSWNLKDDMLRFKKLTIGNGNNFVIMGKNTYLSLNKKPLPKRINIVVSETLFNELNIFKYVPFEGFYIFKNINEAFEYAEFNSSFVNNDNNSKIWIIGGAQLYESCIRDYKINSMYLTKIDKNFNCDVYLGEKTKKFIKNCKWKSIETNQKNKLTYTFMNT